MITKEQIDKILVVRTDRIGEVLLNLPAIRALKQSFNAQVTVLVSPQAAELLSGVSEIDQILLFRQEQWRKNIFYRFKLLRQISQMKFDLAVILNPAKKFHALVALAGIPRRLGYERKWGFLLTHKIKDDKSRGLKHEVEYNLDLVRSIGADTKDLRIAITAAEDEKRSIDNLLLKSGIKAGQIIVAIHPYASNPAKCWPRENFASLMEALAQKPLIKMVIVGAPAIKTDWVHLASSAKDRLVDLSGQTTLKQLVALLQRSALLVSNDSGPVHIAAASGVRVVAIFGRNIPGVGPKRWGPWGDNHTVLQHNPGCSLCLDGDCLHNFKCLTQITPQDVLHTIEGKLNK